MWLDFILPRETRNLILINSIFGDILDLCSEKNFEEIILLKIDLLEINTKEHIDKIEHIIFFIDTIIDAKN